MKVPHIALLLAFSFTLFACKGDAADRQNNAVSAPHKSGIIHANGIDIAYQIDGPVDGMPLVFIVGLGGQMSNGLDATTAALVERGFRVVRFDNRDAGRSTHFSSAGAPPPLPDVIATMQAGQKSPVAYTILDMARDTIGLMDALGIQKAHIVGGSMGGMIAQTLVANFPDRAISLTSVSSTSVNPAIPYGPALAGMMSATTPAKTPQEQLDRQVAQFQAIEGSQYKEDPAILRARIRAQMSRSDDAFANARQNMAIIPYADRRAWLKTIKVPTLVIQGTDDPLYPPAHAQDQVANIPGAKLELIAGMGHTLPDALAGQFADLVAVHARAAEGKP
ncbi:putative hydrolase or acyltransferase of alpha/beta superfamily [Puniceibacterium sp. IMCC21224]|nr:putative hydrolase or acyltransferase of alpha/beta superfamily [Puniceibacterium sp. IMCC21224]